MSCTGAYSIHLKWSGPKQPNGVISHYKLLYKKHQLDPTFNSPAVIALTVEVKVHTHIHASIRLPSFETVLMQKELLNTTVCKIYTSLGTIMNYLNLILI